MKLILKLLNFLLLIVLLIALGLRDVLPVKAVAPDQIILILTHAPSTAANGESFTVNAATDSGLDVSYSAAGGACTNSGTLFTMTSDSGECIVQYDQAGGSGYDPAPQLTETVIAQPSATATATPTATETATAIATLTATATESPTGTMTATTTATQTATATATPHAPGIYVSTTGNDSNPCTSPIESCLTINGAIDKASNGDSIYIANGVYTGSGIYVVIISKNINLLGGWDDNFQTRTGQSIIDGQSTRDGISISGIVSISQLTVQHSFIAIRNSGSLSMNRVSLINNNNGLYNFGNVTLINTTISGNNGASLSGAAISNVSGTVDIQYSTITNNSGNTDYAIRSVNGGAIIKIANSILAGNLYGDCAGSSSNIISGGHNLFGASPACYSYGDPNFIPDGTDKVGTSPMLAPLVFPGYHSPLPGSLAINGATSTCPLATTDQQGLTRPQGSACDIGAYESLIGSIAASMQYGLGSNQSSPINTPYTTALTVYIIDNNQNVVPNTTITFTAPASGASGTFADTHTNTTTVISNNAGIAAAPIFIANSFPGSYTVSATASGLSPITFTLTNLAIPAALSPTGKIILPKPTYRWGKIEGATYYQYELWKGANLIYRKTVAASVCASTTCANTPSTALSPGTYQWRVQAMLNGTWRGFSLYKTFTVTIKAGLWLGKGLGFYVTPTQTSVKKYTVFIYVYGCGSYAITHTTAIRINSTSQFSFTGSFYASGTFTSPNNSSGNVGFSSFRINGCGYVSGGPFAWTAAWKNSSQPAVIEQGLLIPTLIEPLASVQDSDSFTVERVGP